MHQRLSNLPKQDDKHVYGRHENCRINFQTRTDRCLKKFSSKSDSNVNQPEVVLEDKTLSASSTPVRTPRHSNVMESSLCFVCNTRQENDDAHYNDGGKGRCSLDSSKSKLIKAQKICILNENSHFYAAANRLKMDASAPHMTYLPQMYFITNHVTKSLYIFYCSRSVKGNSNKKRRTKKNKNEEVIRRFCSSRSVKGNSNKKRRTTKTKMRKLLEDFAR